MPLIINHKSSDDSFLRENGADVIEAVFANPWRIVTDVSHELIDNVIVVIG